MITPATFTKTLNKFNSASIRQDIVNMTLFCAVKFHSDNNTDPLKRVKEASMPKWIKEAVLSFEYGERDEFLTEEMLEPIVFKHVVLKLMDHNDKLQGAKEVREARKEELQTLRAASVAASPEIGEQGASVMTGNPAKDTGASKKPGPDTKPGPVLEIKPDHDYWLLTADSDMAITKEEAAAAYAAIMELRASKSETTKPKRTRKAKAPAAKAVA